MAYRYQTEKLFLLEGDLATVIGWIGGKEANAHLLLQDIWQMVKEGTLFIARHVHRESNGDADLVEFCIADHCQHGLD